jgi:glycosyltransferase involved in cell wall biosynthesis
MTSASPLRKPPLLYISPTIPATTGNGLAMRAAMMLEALAADHAVHLLVVPVVAGAVPQEISGPVSGWCSRTAIYRAAVDTLAGVIARVTDPSERLSAQLAYPRPALCRFATTRAIREAADCYADVEFSAVHVFRLYMAPFADPYLSAAPERRIRCRLDLDDDESATRLRLANLYETAGHASAAAVERAEARKYAELAERYVPRFDRVYVCSDRDRVEVAGRHRGATVAVIPNAVRIPDGAASSRPRDPATLLFVGNLGYYPNEDAALYLCAEILPRLRALVCHSLRVMIVGANPSLRVQRLASDPDVIVTGAVPDVAAYYRDAGVVVVPIRAGGGTRIKLLEAFAHRCPVVSTTIGAEGIDARHDEHIMLADTAETFAACCARLLADAELADALADRGFELVATQYCPERVRLLLRRDPSPIAP